MAGTETMVADAAGNDVDVARARGLAAERTGGLGALGLMQRWARAGRELDATRQLTRPVLYPAIYPWVVLLAVLDIVLTWTVLRLGGWEVNGIAARVIDRWDVWGMIALKFAVIVLVLMICEYVGRRRPGMGLAVAVMAGVLNTVPVVAATGQLAHYAHLRTEPPRFVVMDDELVPTDTRDPQEEVDWDRVREWLEVHGGPTHGPRRNMNMAPRDELRIEEVDMAVRSTR